MNCFAFSKTGSLQRSRFEAVPWINLNEFRQLRRFALSAHKQRYQKT